MFGIDNPVTELQAKQPPYHQNTNICVCAHKVCIVTYMCACAKCTAFTKRNNEEVIRNTWRDIFNTSKSICTLLISLKWENEEKNLNVRPTTGRILPYIPRAFIASTAEAT